MGGLPAICSGLQCTLNKKAEYSLTKAAKVAALRL
jgi:hypothetical protein